jgi:hypothetical protein
MNETDEQELMARAEGARREATEDVRGKAGGVGNCYVLCAESGSLSPVLRT